MGLQVADHGRAAAEVAEAHLALVGLLPSVDAQVVRKLARVGKALPAVTAAVPLLLWTSTHRTTRAIIAVREQTAWEAGQPSLEHLVLETQTHTQPKAQVEFAQTTASTTI